MSVGWLILGVTLTGLGLVTALQVWMVRRARALEGQKAPDVPTAWSDVVSGHALLVFTSPDCAPCRAMEPAVVALSRRDARVHSIDVTRDTHLARAFGVMATPTTMALRDGVVREVRIGALPLPVLQGMLEA